jgi:signal transduction histidine kinase
VRVVGREIQPSQSLAIEDERERIARDLHDSTSQTLALLQLQLGQLKRSSGAPKIASVVEEIEQTIRDIREQIRAAGRD